MKKIATILSLVFVMCLAGCGKSDSYEIRITIPAGSQEEFVYSDEEISATGKKITISAGEGLGDTMVILSPVNDNVETGYVATYLTPGMPVEFDAVQGEWFKVGISMQNKTDTDQIEYVEVEGVEVRISDNETAPDKITFQAEILEVHEGYFLVEPTKGSWELNSADQIEVPMENMDPSLEPEVGDIIEIAYSGEILETYPARLQEVYSIKVAEEAKWDLKPMVMVNGELYLDTGRESTVEGRCGVMDGEITSTVEGWEKPTEDNQSNFGTGYGYQYGTPGTIEIYMNEKWWVFVSEEAR